jgi:hypothetical protein
LPLVVKNQFIIIHENKSLKAEKEFAYTFNLDATEATHYLVANYNGETVLLDKINGPCPSDIKNLFGRRLTLTSSDIGNGYVWFIGKVVEQIDGIVATL